MISPSRTQQDLATVTLESRTLDRRGVGMSALEAVAWLGGEPPSQLPSCASQVVSRFLASCNDRWPDDDRQLLKPYLHRIVGTRASPEVERQRACVLSDCAVRLWAASALRAAGQLGKVRGARIRDRAEKLATLPPLIGRVSARRAALEALAAVHEIERLAELVEACAGACDSTTINAHAGAYRVAIDATRSAVDAATGVIAGATHVAAGAAIDTVEATEATRLAVAYASRDALPFDRRQTVSQSLAVLDRLIRLPEAPERRPLGTGVPVAMPSEHAGC